MKAQVSRLLSLQCLFMVKNEESYASTSHVPAGHVPWNYDISLCEYERFSGNKKMALEIQVKV
jgi:hypothetical protein